MNSFNFIHLFSLHFIGSRYTWWKNMAYKLNITVKLLSYNHRALITCFAK